MTNKIHLTEKYLVFNGSIQLVAELYYDYSSSAKVLYEVVRVKESTPIFLDRHLDRLWNSLSVLKLMGPTRSVIVSNIKELLLKNPVVENNIRISLVYDLSILPNILIYFIPSTYPTIDQRETGVVVKRLDELRSNPSVKIENSTLREKADKFISVAGCYEVLLVNQEGYATEGSRSNIFFVKDNTLITPPLDMVLGGVTRQVLINIAKENNIPVKEELITINSLSLFDGAILTGTSPGIIPIAAIDDSKLTVSLPLIDTLIELYNREVNNDILRFNL